MQHICQEGPRPDTLVVRIVKSEDKYICIPDRLFFNRFFSLGTNIYKMFLHGMGGIVSDYRRLSSVKKQTNIDLQSCYKCSDLTLKMQVIY